MKDKSTEEILESLTTVRVDMLNEETARLFEVIMNVIDERDELMRTNEQLKKENKKLKEELDRR